PHTEPHRTIQELLQTVERPRAALPVDPIVEPRRRMEPRRASRALVASDFGPAETVMREAVLVRDRAHEPLEAARDPHLLVGLELAQAHDRVGLEHRAVDDVAVRPVPVMELRARRIVVRDAEVRRSVAQRSEQALTPKVDIDPL